MPRILSGRTGFSSISSGSSGRCEINSPAYQRNALIDLRTDESNYEIDQMQPAAVYDELMSYKDDLPEWMWKEIVRLTDLRVNDVNDKDWEKPVTPPPT